MFVNNVYFLEYVREVRFDGMAIACRTQRYVNRKQSNNKNKKNNKSVLRTKPVITIMDITAQI